MDIDIFYEQLNIYNARIERLNEEITQLEGNLLTCETRKQKLLDYKKKLEDLSGKLDSINANISSGQSLTQTSLSMYTLLGKTHILEELYDNFKSASSDLQDALNIIYRIKAAITKKTEDFNREITELAKAITNLKEQIAAKKIELSQAIIHRNNVLNTIDSLE